MRSFHFVWSVCERRGFVDRTVSFIDVAYVQYHLSVKLAILRDTRQHEETITEVIVYSWELIIVVGRTPRVVRMLVAVATTQMIFGALDLSAQGHGNENVHLVGAPDGYVNHAC